jgi:hypothetical protein
MPSTRLTNRISFGRTAYVGRCGSKMLDAIEHSGLRLNGTGDGLVFTGYEELEELVNDLTATAIANSETLMFLKDSLLAIGESYKSAGFAPNEEGFEIGDVIFVK